MGGYQNYGPFLGTLNIRGRIIIGTQKRTIILITTHIRTERILGFESSEEVFLDEWDRDKAETLRPWANPKDSKHLCAQRVQVPNI